MPQTILVRMNEQSLVTNGIVKTIYSAQSLTMSYISFVGKSAEISHVIKLTIRGAEDLSDTNMMMYPVPGTMPLTPLINT